MRHEDRIGELLSIGGSPRAGRATHQDLSRPSGEHRRREGLPPRLLAGDVVGRRSGFRLGTDAGRTLRVTSVIGREAELAAVEAFLEEHGWPRCPRDRREPDRQDHDLGRGGRACARRGRDGAGSAAAEPRQALVRRARRSAGGLAEGALRGDSGRATRGARWRCCERGEAAARTQVLGTAFLSLIRARRRAGRRRRRRRLPLARSSVDVGARVRAAAPVRRAGAGDPLRPLG